MGKLIDLTGQKFGFWEVIERDLKVQGAGKKAKWICKCTACNKTIKSVEGTNLRNGTSTNCGCLRTKALRQSHVKDLSNQIFGFLKVNRQATEEEILKNHFSIKEGIYWNCQCLKCGSKDIIVRTEYLKDGIKKSCGCIQSFNEVFIREILKENNINFKTEYIIPNLKSINLGNLRFDFAIFNDDGNIKYIIEYDGAQHFLNNKAWNKKLITTHQNDILKNKYCFENNIPIIRIPYYSNYSKEDLFLDTTRYLLTPNNTNEYYRFLEKEGLK